jgi:hypothetical protein
VSGKWTPRWVYHRGTPGLAARLIPYCTMDGGPADKVHPPDEGQILAPVTKVEQLEAERDEARADVAEWRLGRDVVVANYGEFKERLIRQGAEVLGQRAYERAITDFPLVTPRWDKADPKVRAAFTNQGRGDLVNFVLPAIAASENPESTEEGR